MLQGISRGKQNYVPTMRVIRFIAEGWRFRIMTRDKRLKIILSEELGLLSPHTNYIRFKGYLVGKTIRKVMVSPREYGTVTSIYIYFTTGEQIRITPKGWDFTMCSYENYNIKGKKPKPEPTPLNKAINHLESRINLLQSLDLEENSENAMELKVSKKIVEELKHYFCWRE